MKSLLEALEALDQRQSVNSAVEKRGRVERDDANTVSTTLFFLASANLRVVVIFR